MASPVSASRSVRLGGSHEEVPVGKILALGGNYQRHIAEMGGGAAFPSVFLKPASALVRSGGAVRRPPFSLQLHHELELVVAIGEPAVAVRAARALEHVLGYAVGLDMTLRDVQTEAKRRGRPWSVAKGFDTAAPVSDVVPAAAAGDPANLEIELEVNGERRQHGRAGDMTMGIAEIIEHLSHIFTLDRGDLIFTGTPEGVDTVYPGDRLAARLVGHAELLVTVEDAAPAQSG